MRAQVPVYLAGLALVGALYYGAARVGLQLAYLHGAVTALWPPVGVGIAALVLYGPRLWPGIVVGDLLAGDYSTPIGTVLGQTAGNTLEVLVAALLLRRLIGPRPSLERVQDVFALLGCAAVGTAISASVGVLSLRLGNVIGAHEAGEVWRTWWLSDTSGALVVTPLILTWVAHGTRRLPRGELLEGLAMLAVLVALAEIPSQRDVPYVVFPVLIWAALRLGTRWAATGIVVVSALTVWNTAHNAGPFVRQSITDSLLASQLFLAIAALTSLVLAAVTAERARADEALRANEERRRSVVQAMAEGLIVRDADGVIIDCNAAAERITGRDRGELLGRRPVEALGSELEPGTVVRLERPDGTPAWVSISAGVARDAAGRVEGIVSTLSDITERRRAEQRLVASELAQRALADEQAALRRIATLVAADTPPEELFARVTAEVGRLLGAPSAAVVRYEDERTARIVGGWGKPDSRRLPVGAAVALDGDSVIARVHRSGAPERLDDYHRADGDLAEAQRVLGRRSAIAAPVRVGGRLWGALAASTGDPDGLPQGSEGRLCDFADLIAQALANADAHQKLAASRARIVEAGDAERRRLERNLHDGAQQRLVSLALQLRIADAKLESYPPGARAILAEAADELARALEELRELARGIHPAVLTDRGLGPALEALATRAPVPVVLSELPQERLPEPVEAAAYYVVAEAITNVAKYAQASRVTVTVSRSDGRALVEVADDGIGGADAARGSGLRGLADRVEALDGRLRLESPPRRGTRLRAEIPLGSPSATAG